MSAKEISPRLGRGLAALMGDTVALRPMGQSTPGVINAPVDLVESGPFQPRGPIDPESLAELVDSIRAHGVLQPLLARPHPTTPGHFQIVAGERRWRAAQAAGLHEVPVLVRDLRDADALAAALVENLQRVDLNAIEEAEGYRKLIDEFGMTQEALAAAVGKSRSHIANTMRLLNLPPTVQQEVRNGALSAGHARALLAHPEPAKAAVAVIARGLNVRQTEAFSTRRSGSLSPSPDRPDRATDPETVALERDLTERLGMKVEISFDGKGGMLRIRYRSIDQLDGLIALLSRN